MATISNINLSTSTQIGASASELLGFFGATAIVQPVGAAQAAVATTAATNSTPYGFSQAQADAIIALVNAMRLALVNLGLIKGAA